MTRLACVSAVALLVVGSLACSGGGGIDGGGNPIDTLEPLFAADPNPAGASLSMEAGPVTGDVFDVRIVVDSLADLYGAAFLVEFDTDVLDFVSSSGAGSAIGGTGVATNFTAAESDPGVLFVNASRQSHALGGEDIGASPQLLVTLTFRAVAESAGSAIDFGTTNREVQTCPVPLEPCTPLAPGAVSWAGGTVVVTP